MKKTIYDIANEIGVAPSSVSKALSGAPGISDKLRKKIIDYANSVKYFPNANASKLKLKKAYSIGIVYSEELGIGLEHNYFSSILQYFKTFVENKGYEISFVINNLENREMSYLDYCRHKNIDGVFVLTSVMSNPYLQELIDSDISCVSTDIYLDDLTTIISDNVLGAKKAVQYLYDRGYRSILHIKGPSYSLAAKERLAGYLEKMKELQLDVSEEETIQVHHFSYEAGYLAGEEFIKRDYHNKGVFVISDVVAMGFIKCLIDNGISVPDDISVIGFDDLPIANYFIPSLTTIRQYTKLIGEVAAEKLLNLIDGKSEKEKNIVRLPVDLIIRDSTK